MDHGELSRRILAMVERTSALREQLEHGCRPVELLQALAQDLWTSIEELRVADDEMQRQSVDVARSHAQAEHDRRRYRRMFMAAPVAYVVTSRDGVIIDANDAAGRLFDATSRALSRKPLAVFVVPDDRGRFGRIVDEIASADEVPVEDELMMRSPRERRMFPARVRVSPERTPEGRVCGHLWVIEDLSTAHRARMADQLAEDAERKDEFLAMLSHELRNPLAPVRAAVDLWRTQGEAMNPEQRQYTVDVVGRQIDHLAHLIDDLLDVARVSHGQINLRREVLDLRLVVDQALDIVESNALLHHLEVESPDEPVLVNGDEMRLRQIIVDLLENALKYTAAGRHVFLRVDTDDDQAVIAVRDEGVGLDPAMLETIFGLFSQGAQPLSRSQGGLGVGLTLVRRLVALHGGTVAAHSEGVGRGSEFVVRLPLVHAELTPSRDTVNGERVPLGPLRVLIADDNVDAAEMLAVLLESEGHETTLAFDGAGAIAAFQRSQPDVVLLDLGLPDLDGFEVSRRIKDAAPSVPLIAVTGYGDEGMRARTRECGFSSHLLKPLDFEALRRTLESVMVRPVREPTTAS